MGPDPLSPHSLPPNPRTPPFSHTQTPSLPPLVPASPIKTQHNDCTQTRRRSQPNTAHLSFKKGSQSEEKNTDASATECADGSFGPWRRLFIVPGTSQHWHFIGAPQTLQTEGFKTKMPLLRGPESDPSPSGPQMFSSMHVNTAPSPSPFGWRVCLAPQ